jgi:hypothetical protein
MALKMLGEEINRPFNIIWRVKLHQIFIKTGKFVIIAPLVTYDVVEEQFKRPA